VPERDKVGLTARTNAYRLCDYLILTWRSEKVKREKGAPKRLLVQMIVARGKENAQCIM
jgi:hypothetical protein